MLRIGKWSIVCFLVIYVSPEREKVYELAQNTFYIEKYVPQNVRTCKRVQSTISNTSKLNTTPSKSLCIKKCIDQPLHFYFNILFLWLSWKVLFSPNPISISKITCIKSLLHGQKCCGNKKIASFDCPDRIEGKIST